MIKISLSLPIIFFIFVSNLYAVQDKWSQQLYDSIRWAEDGNTVIIDLEQIKLSIANGADPKWIKIRKGRVESILSRYVTVICMSRLVNPETVKKGFKGIEILFEHGAKLQYCDGAILYFPIASGKYDIVKLLLENGASATFWPKDEIGSAITPIEVATQCGHDKIVNLLISYGAKRLSEKDAVQAKFVEVAFMGTLDDLKGQIKKGARVNIKDRQGRTALIGALMPFDHNAYIKVIYLLDLGADVNLKGLGVIKSRAATLPLHVAIRLSSFLFRYKKNTIYAEQILKELIKRGAFVSGRDEDDKTPLHIASKYNHLYAAQLLLESGSKVMPKDKSGKTPLDYAESAEMIKLLKNHGAKE